MSNVLTAEDRLEIVQTTLLTCHYADTHDWEKIANLVTDPFQLDYTELLGGSPQVLTPKQLVENWHLELGGLDTSQHLLTSHIIEPNEDGAICTANLHATHVLANSQGDSKYVVAGRYTFAMRRTSAGWRVASQKMHVIYTSGNPGILQLGEARIKAKK